MSSATAPTPVDVQPSSLVQGRLPDWGPWAVYGGLGVIGVIAIVAGGMNMVLAAVVAAAAAGAIVYTWARVVEGSRRATDRAITLFVSSAFAVAVVPLVSVIYVTVSRGADDVAHVLREELRVEPVGAA